MPQFNNILLNEGFMLTIDRIKLAQKSQSPTTHSGTGYFQFFGVGNFLKNRKFFFREKVVNKGDMTERNDQS